MRQVARPRFAPPVASDDGVVWEPPSAHEGLVAIEHSQSQQAPDVQHAMQEKHAAQSNIAIGRAHVKPDAGVGGLKKLRFGAASLIRRVPVGLPQVLGHGAHEGAPPPLRRW